MNGFAFYLITAITGVVLTGCSSLMNSEIHVAEAGKNSSDAARVKYLATVRIGKYTDARNVANTRKIGISEERVLGLSGKEITLDRDVTDVVSDSLRKRLNDAGILAKDDASALFELSGVVKDLS